MTSYFFHARTNLAKTVSIDSTCTILTNLLKAKVKIENEWSALTAWGPVSLLPIIDILGTDPDIGNMTKCTLKKFNNFDVYGNIQLDYPDAIGIESFGKAVKSEGSLIISGTEGYICTSSLVENRLFRNS